jgi:F-type H+-transporting ATPase subunit beta
VAEQFTWISGAYVKMEDTISGFEKLINGECDEIPEEFFMYKWKIQDVINDFEKSKII